MREKFEQLLKEYTKHSELDIYLMQIIKDLNLNLTIEQIITVNAINTLAFDLMLENFNSEPTKPEHFIHDEGEEPENV
jgi:hypothetical protein